MGLNDTPSAGDTGEVSRLRAELDELKTMVQTLLSIILEEADGVSSGAAPRPAGAPPLGYAM